MKKTLMFVSLFLVENLHAGPFKITLDFPDESIPRSYRRSFYQAAKIWENNIVRVPGLDGHNLRITAKARGIDRKGGTLAQAGIEEYYEGTNIPAAGMMEFDRYDLQNMYAEKTLENTVKHEMLHVIGFGTMWEQANLVKFYDKNNPMFVGEAAISFYRDMANNPKLKGVPIANTGGAGTFGGHWRESVFDNEIMTGYLNAGDDPISKLTLASLEDLGYRVSYQNSDFYHLEASNIAYVNRNFSKLDFVIGRSKRICDTDADLCHIMRVKPANSLWR